MAADRDEILLVMLNGAYVRGFESVLRALLERGLGVTVLIEERKHGGDDAGLALLARLREQYGTFRFELRPEPPLRARGLLRMALEAGEDYLRYFEPPYGEGRKLRARSVARLPDRVERALAFTLRRATPVRRLLAGLARRTAPRLGTDPRIRRELERRRPGAVIVTPLVHFRSRQGDWIRAAGALGIGTMLCIHGWDNLTNRGLMHALPDRIAVWNDAQRDEAVSLHGATPHSIVVTGAWPYDHWFGWRASRSRPELCRQLELPEGRAMILYACSSRFIAENERAAVGRWVRALRSAADPRVATANVIVRPHPLNRDEWGGPSLADLAGATVFPPNGADPTEDSSRADYYDSIANADAVVGVNTSALVESAIVDRPALAFPGPEFRASQEELPHFHRLIGEQGLVRVSLSMAEHVAQLSEALADPAAGAAVRRRFVETFIRPRGGEPPPTERVVAAIAELLLTQEIHWSSGPPPAARMHA